jgi:hypothetical protein
MIDALLMVLVCGVVVVAATAEAMTDDARKSTREG